MSGTSAVSTTTTTSGTGSPVSSEPTGASDSEMSSSSDMTPESAISSEAPSVTSSSSPASTSVPRSTVSRSTVSKSTVSKSTVSKSTVGAAGGKLDAQSTTWFSTLCTSLEPIATLNDFPQLSASNIGQLREYADRITNIGTNFSASAAQLKQLPAPTFPGGADYADKSVAAVAEFGNVFSQLGQKLKAGDAAGLASLSDVMQSGPIKDLSGLELDTSTSKSIAAIPACKKIDFH